MMDMSSLHCHLLESVLRLAVCSQALCSEAALRALYRTYPQVYETDEKLVLDYNAIQVQEEDFVVAMKKVSRME